MASNTFGGRDRLGLRKLFGARRLFKPQTDSRRRKIGIAVGFFGLCSGAVITAALAQVALPDTVEITPLATDAFSTGTLDRAGGALPATLWRDSDPQKLDFLLGQAPSRPAAPSLGEAMKRTLLSPGAGPEGAAPSLGGKKLLALARAGFIDEARTVESISSAARDDAWTEQAVAVIDLLTDDTAAACQRSAGLSSGRDEIFWVKLRVFCYAQAGERDAADLTLKILRERGAVTANDDQYLNASATGAAPKTPLPIVTALQYAIGKSFGAPIAPGLLANADGGVLVAVARDASLATATRISAAEQAVAMGVMDAGVLAGIIRSASFEVSEIGNAPAIARERASDPLMDALLFQSVQEMTAPEFIRDKAQRIALSLDLADSFHRAYALSVLYADEIAALEGVILSPEEAARFAVARMAVGDSVGASRWLAAMIGANESVAALPEPQAMAFIERVNLLAVLDPQSAARIARGAGVSLLSEEPNFVPVAKGHADAATMARILEAAFDAVGDEKAGQAGLAALAASNGSAAGGEIEAVVVKQSLSAAGLGALRRRHDFEHAWSAMFAQPQTGVLSPASASETSPEPQQAAEEEGGITPRLKPQSGQ